MRKVSPTALANATAVLVLLVALASVAKRMNSLPTITMGSGVTDVEPLDDAPSMGNEDAPIAIVEYADFQCRYCEKFANDELPDVIDRYVKTGKVLFVFRVWPLNEAPGPSIDAAIIARCAAKQGRFWTLHNKLFAHTVPLRPITDAAQLGQEIGLDGEEFKQCLSRTTAAEAAVNARRARDIGLSGTPTFLVGRIRNRVLHVAYRLTGGTKHELANAIDTLLTRRD